MESGLSRNEIIQQLTRSPHGKLEEYIPVAKDAARHEDEFLAHLIAWNFHNGQIRDAKVALPVVALSVGVTPFTENALAHLAMLDPRNLVRAWHFAKTVGIAPFQGKLNLMIGRYLQFRERHRPLWERAALQHRESMKSLYALTHTKPAIWANNSLFKGRYPLNSPFEVVRRLSSMAPIEAAGAILEKKIPFLVAMGALGVKAKEEVLVMALINQMSPTELVTNAKMLERLGVRNSPALRSAFEAKLAEASGSKKGTFKTQKAVEAVSDATLKAKLENLQEQQIDSLGRVQGDWLVLGDRSPSMEAAIEPSRLLAATLARMAGGKVHLIFFDSTPRYLDATGKTLAQIQEITKNVHAGGSGTSIGCGLQYVLEKGWNVDGIAIATDGGENSPPFFHVAYQTLIQRLGKQPPVYLYLLPGSGADAFSGMMERAGFALETFDLRKQKIDYYALPSIIGTMRSNRYSLADEIFEVPLKTLDEVFKDKTILEAA
jgi:hypothetical protein